MPRRGRSAALALAASAGLLSWGLTAGAVAYPSHARAANGEPRTPRDWLGPNWIGTWQMAPTAAFRPPCQRCTIRNIVHTSVGGTWLRVRLSNDFGGGTLRVEHTTLALPTTPGHADALPGSMRDVAFGGQRSVLIPAHGQVVSDPVPLDVGPDRDLLVTTYTPDPGSPLAYHPSAQQNSYLSDGPDHAAAIAGGALPTRTVSYWVASGVEARAAGQRGTLVAFGDSITDGAGSTVGAAARWPDDLARRLSLLPPGQRLSVVNAGIGGNRILLDGGVSYGPRALSRFGRDVLDQAGVRVVIMLIGINDIQQRPPQLDPGRITAGLAELADRAHDQGVLVLGGTLTPYQGWHDQTAAGERTRQAVNDWIRRTRTMDGYIDFDAALRDPASPGRLLARYDSGDHLHPNDAGYLRMAAAVNLAELWPRWPGPFG